MSEALPERVDFVTGDETGLRIPAHGEALFAAGPAYLTEAFRAFGSIAADNAVTRIAEFTPCNIGSTGQKFFLTVEYARDDGLPGELFVKFSRDFTDMFRDYRRAESEEEINLAVLSRNPNFPIAVPIAFLADYHRESGTGIIVSERIRFGRDGIEPMYHKCMDHELANPEAYYRVILSALAKLAGAHKTGKLSPQLETLFPFDPEGEAVMDTITHSEARILELIGRIEKFMQDCPQLLPENIRAPAFLARFRAEAPILRRHQETVRRYLQQDPDYIAFTHFNTQIDNAWFWRDAAGALHCGLLDWQRARQMNLGYALWGCLSGAEPEIWNAHLDELVGFFIDEFEKYGGPRLDLVELKRNLDLNSALMGLANLMHTPAIVLKNLPEAATASGPLDPVFEKSEAARTVLHMFTAFTNFWDRHDVGASVELVLRRMA